MVKYCVYKALSCTNTESAVFPAALLTYNCTERSHPKSFSLCFSPRSACPAKSDSKNFVFVTPF